MENAIKTDFALDEHCRFLAAQILEEISKHGGEIEDLLHETIDGDANTFTYHLAHSICQNCNISAGEDFIEETGNPEDGWSYHGMACAIAYGEMLYRTRLFLEEMKSEQEAA